MKSRLDIYGESDHPIYEWERYGLTEQKLYEWDKYQVQSTEAWKWSEWPLAKLPEDINVYNKYNKGLFWGGYAVYNRMVPSTVDFKIFKVSVWNVENDITHTNEISKGGYLTEEQLNMPYDDFVENYGYYGQKQTYEDALFDSNYSYPNEGTIIRYDGDGKKWTELSYDYFMSISDYHFLDENNKNITEDTKAADRIPLAIKEFDFADDVLTTNTSCFRDASETAYYRFTGRILHTDGTIENAVNKIVARSGNGLNTDYPHIDDFRKQFTNDLYLIRSYFNYTEPDLSFLEPDEREIGNAYIYEYKYALKVTDTTPSWIKKSHLGYKHPFPYRHITRHQDGTIDSNWNLRDEWSLYTLDTDGNFWEVDLQLVAQTYLFFGWRYFNNDGSINSYLSVNRTSYGNRMSQIYPVRLVWCKDDTVSNRNPLDIKPVSGTIGANNWIIEYSYQGFAGYSDKVYDDGRYYLPNVNGNGVYWDTREIIYFLKSREEFLDEYYYEYITTFPQGSYVPCYYHYWVKFNAKPWEGGWKYNDVTAYPPMWQNLLDTNLNWYITEYGITVDDFMIDSLITGNSPTNKYGDTDYWERVDFHLAINPSDKYTCEYYWYPKATYAFSKTSRYAYPDNGISNLTMRFIAFTKLSGYSSTILKYDVNAALTNDNTYRYGYIPFELLRYNDAPDGTWYPVTPDGNEVSQQALNNITCWTYYEGTFQTDPVRGRRLGRVSSYDETAYPKDDSVYNGYSYDYIGSTTVEYVKSPTPLDIFSSTSPNTYPENGMATINDVKYWFVSKGQRKIIINSYEPSVLLDNINYSQSIGSSSQLAIGAVGGASIIINVLKPLVEVLPYINHEADIYYYYSPDNGFQSEGLFTFKEATENGLNRTLITAYDNVYKLDIPAKPLLDKLPLPMTAQQLFVTVCAYCGIPYDANIRFFNSNALVTEPFGDDNTTCRDVITWIAQIAASTVIADLDGKLIFKEMVQPERSRGSRAANTMRLDSSMLKIQKPTGIKYKYEDEEYIVRANSQDDDYLLDYSENPFTFNADQSITESLLLDTIAQIDGFGDLYAFTVDIPANSYGISCGDSWVVSANGVEPRRGIVSDKTINSSGVTFTSSGEIEALTRDLIHSETEIDDLIDEVDSLFNRITINQITFEDIYFHEIYQTINDNVTFQTGATTYNNHGILFDISEQFLMFFQGYQNIEVIVNDSVMIANIVGDTLQFVNPDYLPLKLKNLQETKIYNEGSLYDTYVNIDSNLYKNAYTFDTNLFDLHEYLQTWVINNQYFNRFVQNSAEPVEQPYINENGEVVYHKVNTYNFNTAALLYLLRDEITRTATLLETAQNETVGFGQRWRITIGDEYFEYMTTSPNPAQSMTWSLDLASGIISTNFIGIDTLQQYTVNGITFSDGTTGYLTVHNSSEVVSLPITGNGGTYDIYNSNDEFVGYIEWVLDLDALSNNIVQYQWDFYKGSPNFDGFYAYQVTDISFANNTISCVISKYLSINKISLQAYCSYSGDTGGEYEWNQPPHVPVRNRSWDGYLRYEDEFAEYLNYRQERYTIPAVWGYKSDGSDSKAEYGNYEFIQNEELIYIFNNNNLLCRIAINSNGTVEDKGWYTGYIYSQAPSHKDIYYELSRDEDSSDGRPFTLNLYYYFYN